MAGFWVFFVSVEFRVFIIGERIGTILLDFLLRPFLFFFSFE